MRRIILRDSQGETLMLDNIYPVGSIYMSVNSTNPGTLFGGTWAQIQDRFLLACGSTYANGATGGEATHTLTENEMPTHKHLSGNVNSYVTGTTSGNQWMTLMTRAANDETNYNTNTGSVGGGCSAQQYAAVSGRIYVEADCVTLERWCS